MYLSSLLIDVGDNPDRPRPGRLWLRNPYHVHQRLCMAFPSNDRKSRDAEFLGPFNPEDFAGRPVQVRRDAAGGFLFRVDSLLGGRAMILVQSATPPDWNYAFHNAGYLLAAAPHRKEYKPCFTIGQRLQFRLLANPTRKVCTKSEPGGEKNNGKRIPVQNEQMGAWLAARAERGGFAVIEASTALGYAYVRKPKVTQVIRLRSVRYDGVLEVVDTAAFGNALLQGIGPEKAFGFGLLSVAPLHGASSEAAA